MTVKRFKELREQGYSYEDTKIRIAQEAGLEAFKKLPLEEKLKRLQKIGIINENGELTKEYGGKG